MLQAIRTTLTNNAFETRADVLSRIPFNRYFYKAMPLIFNGFKCEKCLFVSVAYKTTKKHFLQAHERAAGSRVKARHPHILHGIPLSFLVGFDGNTRSYFIPRFQNTLDHPAGGESSDSVISDANLASFEEQELHIRRAQLQAASALNVNKEEDFFNRSTRYYKYLQGKDIPTLLATVHPSALNDPLLMHIHDLTMDLGMEAFALVPSLSVGTRELVNTFYTSAVEMHRIRPFQELNPSTRRQYLRGMCMFVVYLVSLHQHNNFEYPEPVLCPALQQLLRALEANVQKSTQGKATIEASNQRVLKVQILEILDMVLSTKLEASFMANKSFENPFITYFILRCLKASYYESNEHAEGIIFGQIKTIQGLMSSLIYAARLYTVAYLHHLSLNNAINDPTGWVASRLTSTSQNYFAELFALRTMMKGYAMKQISEYKPIDRIDAEMFIFNNIPIRIPTLRTMFHDTLHRLEDLFFQDVVYLRDTTHDGPIPIDLATIRDNKDDAHPLGDLSTMTDLQQIRNTLIKRVLDSKTAIHQRFRDSTTQKQEIQTYFTTVEQFLKLLAVTVHLLSSSPLRGTELSMIKFRNSQTGTLRNVFLDKTTSLIALETTNLSKERDSTRAKQSNIRFLPERLTRIILYHITFVIPLVEYFNITYFDAQLLETRLFVTPRGRAVGSTALTRELHNVTAEYFDEGFGISDYRHIITNVIKEAFKEEVHLLSPRVRKVMEGQRETRQEEHRNRIEDILAGHSTLTANMHYARDKNFFSNRTRDITNRSLAFSRRYFEFFQMDADRSLADIIRTTAKPFPVVATSSGSSEDDEEDDSDETYSDEATSRDAPRTPSPDALQMPSPDAPRTPSPDAPRTPSPDALQTTSPDAPQATSPDAPLTSTNLGELEQNTTSPSRRTVVRTFLQQMSPLSDNAFPSWCPPSPLPNMDALDRLLEDSDEDTPGPQGAPASTTRGLETNLNRFRFTSSLAPPSSAPAGPSSKRSFTERDSVPSSGEQSISWGSVGEMGVDENIGENIGESTGENIGENIGESTGENIGEIGVDEHRAIDLESRVLDSTKGKRKAGKPKKIKTGKKGRPQKVYHYQQ